MYFSTFTIASLSTLVRCDEDTSDEVAEAIVEEDFGDMTGCMATLSVE